MRFLRGVFLFAAAMLLLGATAAQAQMSCYSCDPYGPCGVSCEYCLIEVDPEYGVCPYGYLISSTCDEYVGACTEYGCNPNWQETNRTTVGQYGEVTYGFICSPWPFCYPSFGCEHHRVDRVTETDQNGCNINESYNTRQFCDDWEDFSLPHRLGNPPDCCAYPAYCNDWHSCW